MNHTVDMKKDLFAAIVWADKPKAFVVFPGFDDTFLLHCRPAF
jgi:hypothetical protein